MSLNMQINAITPQNRMAFKCKTEKGAKIINQIDRKFVPVMEQEVSQMKINSSELSRGSTLFENFINKCFPNSKLNNRLQSLKKHKNHVNM